MLTKQQLAANLLAIVEKVLERMIAPKISLDYLLTVPDPIYVDELQLIKYGIRNYDLITPAAIERQIKTQINKSKRIVGHGFKLRQPVTTQHDFATRWQQYGAKLANILQQVEYRSKHNYCFNTRLPSQKQLLELEQECRQLTAEWYGAEHANINLCYLFFVKMCVAANIVRYDYYKMNKHVSSDQYVMMRDLDQVRQATEQYMQNFYKPFIEHGGRWAHGRSEIDATTISNVFYYKQARQLFYLEYAKQLVIDELQLEDYGQLPADKRKKLWDMIVNQFPADTSIDKQSIFYKFATYINTNPGEYFNYFAAELPEACNIPGHELYEVVKFCGLQSGQLVIISRTITEDWMPKRYLTLAIQRKYPLLELTKNGSEHVLRQAKAFEHIRVWPNEMPYYPEHGLGLCGDGLIEGLDDYGSAAYEWNTPIDPGAEYDNSLRDVEMIFRQMSQLAPYCKHKTILPGEQLINIYQSALSYSSIPETNHVHITRGGIDRYLIYQLPALLSATIPGVNATFELVQVGTQRDAIYLRVFLNDIYDEAVIVFLQHLHFALLKQYCGINNYDANLRLFQNMDGSGVFIYEPQMRLIRLDDGTFLNPENQQISKPRPQWSIPEGGMLYDFTNEYAGGLDYAREYFDQVRKQDVQLAIADYIANYSVSHQ